jgi:hypothetical protein
LYFEGTYNDEVIRRVLVLKKLDGFPVIRENMEEEKEEEMTTLDMKEIQNMAEELEVDQVYRSFCLTRLRGNKI